MRNLSKIAHFKRLMRRIDDDLQIFLHLRAIAEGASNFAQTTKQASVTFRTSLQAFKKLRRFVAGSQFTRAKTTGAT